MKGKLTKAISSILVIILVLASLAPIAKALDTNLEKQGIDTTSNTVKLDIYFKNEEGGKTHTKQGKLDEKDMLYVYLKVEEGYVKGGEITLDNPNFALKGDTIINDNIASISGNKIALNQIRNGEEIELAIPIEKIEAEEIDVDYFGKETACHFTASQVKNDGRTAEIRKDLTIYKKWQGESKLNIEQGITKYIVEETRIILEQKIKVNLENNSLPIEKEKIETEIPLINGTAPKYIYVNGTANELTGEEIDETNWKKQENTVKIEVANTIKNNKITWKKGVKDEYSIIYIYENDAKKETYINPKASKTTTVKLNTKAETVAYNQERTKYDIEDQKQGALKENVNSIVMMELEVAKEIQKGKMYLEEGNPSYKENYVLEIARPEIENIEVTSKGAIYQTEEEVNAKYLKTEVSKRAFDKILGTDGKITITNESGLEVAKITNKTKVENGKYVVEYEAKEIKVNLSKTQNVGKIKIENTKEIEENKTEEDIKKLEKITSKIEGTVGTDIKFVKEEESVLKEPQTKIETSINKQALSTAVKNENVEIKTVLVAEDETCKLLENPKIEITLPEAVEKIDFSEGKLLFTDELKIKRAVYTKEARLIEIEVEGKQTKFNDVSVAKGPTILINCDLTLNEKTTLKEGEIKVAVKETEEEVQNKIKVGYITPIISDEDKVEVAPEIDQAEQQPTTEAPVQEPTLPTQEVPAQEMPAQQVPAPQITTPLRAPLQDVTLKIESDVEDKDVLEGSVINYKATVVNTGEKVLRNAVLSMPVPVGTKLREYVVGDSYTSDKIVEKDDAEKKITIDTLEPNKPYTVEMEVLVAEKENNATISNNAVLNVEGYDTLTSNVLTNNVKNGLLNINLFTDRIKTSTYKSGDTVEIYAKIKNISKTKTLRNVKAEIEIPEELEYLSSEYYNLEDVALSSKNYDADSRKLTFEINQISPAKEKIAIIKCRVKEGVTSFKAQVKANYQDVSEYAYSNEIERLVENPKLEVKYYSDITNQYVNEGDKIKYYIEIKNIGAGTANNVEIDYTMPEGLENVNLSYTNKTISKDNISIENKSQKFSSYTVDAGDTLLLTIETKIAKLAEDAKGIINYTSKATITANDLPAIETSEITHKVKVISQKEDGKLSISGTAWEDTSRDGIKDEGEKLLKNIKVVLITKEDAVKVKETKTNKYGEYIFKDVEPGEYIVVFEYDTSKYEITKYEIEKASDDKTSNGAITQATFLKDGSTIDGAITDVIKVEESSLYNINLGIREKANFDLSLEKKISKITVKTASEVKTYDYTGSPKDLAKIELASKEINGASVIIEYKIKVSNKGNIDGYVNKIVDYIPKDLKFKSELNKTWYQDTDGNLYTKELEGIAIKPGETKEISIILTKELTENNLGNTNNSAEIAESTNNYGIKDKNSEAGNKNIKENDYGSADLIISLNTGTIIMYITLSISMIALISVGAYMIKKYVLGNN